ncbi:hypothetical protein SOASR030_01800 [Leminorella grimontii]|uniref:DUF1391 domain-containing protein n=1 Tax=Leminorella grimontii TaxID=82981 RepID=A0AAV5MZF9_9GAMM|nr:DUF1391 family protein [Leminorella grimontii]GKX54068.1 hypothetical protein SOASR030_01800 [Leminorella grimontii]VFS60158.1 Protein of uncharacterised function (DUF1391) [Leminorella grimontii]
MFKQVDFGNNESSSIGVFKNENGYTAMTFSKSKDFKTEQGALSWLARQGIDISELN